MNDRARKTLSKYFLTVLVLFMLSLTLALAQRYAGLKAEATLREAAAAAVAAKIEGKYVLGDRIAVVGSGFPGSAYAFAATLRGKTAGIAFVSPIMGNSGPYTAVFFWTPDVGARFCSVVGIDASSADPERLGITPRALGACERRLDALAAQSGVIK